MAIIGVSGKIGVGKDEVGKIIQFLTSSSNKVEGYEEWLQRDQKPFTSWQVKKYADKLKDIVCLLIGCTREQLEDRAFKEKELGREWDIWEIFGIGSYDIFNSKESAMNFFRNSSRDLNLPVKKSLTPRKLLQILGTEEGRQIIHPDIWVNALMSDYVRDYNGVTSGYVQGEKLSYPDWVVTDVRFVNEVNSIKRRQGIVIRVNRGGILRENEHDSETALDNYDNWDEVVENNGTLSELVDKIKLILKKYGVI